MHPVENYLRLPTAIYAIRSGHKDDQKLNLNTKWYRNARTNTPIADAIRIGLLCRSIRMLVSAAVQLCAKNMCMACEPALGHRTEPCSASAHSLSEHTYGWAGLRFMQESC